jgi:hypothetical protein
LPDTGSDDPTIVAALESNGGRNNVIVQGMWAEFDPHEYSQGKWGFFSPCMTNGAYDNRCALPLFQRVMATHADH